VSQVLTHDLPIGLDALDSNTRMPYEEEDTCMPYEEEDTCMPYEEEDTPAHRS